MVTIHCCQLSEKLPTQQTEDKHRILSDSHLEGERRTVLSHRVGTVIGICTASLAKSRCLERCLMKWPEVKQKQFCPPVPWLWLWIPLYRRRAKNIFKVIVTPCPWAQTHCLQCISYLTVITPALLFMLLWEQGIFSYIIVFSPHDKPTRAGSWLLFYKVVVQVHTTIKVKWGLEQWILILILGFVLLLLLCIAS